jgi:hypothetical protein
MVRETVVENERKEWRSPELKEINLLDTEGKNGHAASETGSNCGPAAS